MVFHMNPKRMADIENAKLARVETSPENPLEETALKLVGAKATGIMLVVVRNAIINTMIGPWP